MKVENPVTESFISHYPVEAARVLEQVSSEDSAVLFSELAAESVVPVLSAMLPGVAADTLAKMATERAAKLLTDMPIIIAAQILRYLGHDKRKQITERLSGKTTRRINRILEYTPLSAGDLMGHVPNMLPGDLTVADAIRRIENARNITGCEIYIIDNQHRLIGMIEVGKLLTTRQNKKLRDLCSGKIHSVSVHTRLDKLVSHRGWNTQHSIAVVEKGNVLVGVLDYRVLKEVTAETPVEAHDTSKELLSLVVLYWQSLTKLLEVMLSTANQK